MLTETEILAKMRRLNHRFWREADRLPPNERNVSKSKQLARLDKKIAKLEKEHADRLPNRDVER